MVLPKQKADESDSDFAVRLEKSKEAKREAARQYYQANREYFLERRKRHYEANREALLEYGRKNRERRTENQRRWRKNNPERARELRRKCHHKNYRKWSDAKTLAHAKGKPLRSNFTRAQRPQMLTRLLLQEAENFCLEWGFKVEQKFDTDVLLQAARTIRDSVDLNGEPNPWYCTDYLHESTITGNNWSYTIRRTWRNKA